MTLPGSGYNIARLMPSDLPQYLEPLRLVRQQARLSGVIPVQSMPRLVQATLDNSGEVTFELAFARDAGGVDNISGQFSTQVTLACQRCLQPLPVQVTARIAIGIVQGPQQAKQLPAEYEPLEVGAEPISLLELIEDEVLLALPFAPLHPEGECPASVLPESGRETLAARQRPFAQLVELKRRRKNKPDRR